MTESLDISGVIVETLPNKNKRVQSRTARACPAHRAVRGINESLQHQIERLCEAANTLEILDALIGNDAHLSSTSRRLAYARAGLRVDKVTNISAPTLRLYYDEDREDFQWLFADEFEEQFTTDKLPERIALFDRHAYVDLKHDSNTGMLRDYAIFLDVRNERPRNAAQLILKRRNAQEYARIMNTQ